MRCLLALLLTPLAFAVLTRLEVERTELILNGKPFRLAGASQKIVGKAHFTRTLTCPPRPPSPT